MQRLVVAAAQVASGRGDVEGNVAAHLRVVKAAAAEGVHLLVFPELSLTGYELDLGALLQFDTDDARLGPFRRAARKHDMHLVVGGPWASGGALPLLAAFLVGPEATVPYAKVHVHESEAPFFAAGTAPCVVDVRGVPTALAVCADTSHPEHAAAAASLGARLYVASVAKVPDEYDAHAELMAGHAARHGMAALTANYTGRTGGARSAGRSAAWGERGQLLAQAPAIGEALLVVRHDGGAWTADVVDLPLA
jgi:predicted amidohydrolase